MLEALKRLAMSGDMDKLHYLPDVREPIRMITPINSDRRYRQYTEIKIPSSNAVIFFARDCSGSMDDYRCDVVSDMSWWIDCWIRRFYDRVERCYFVHDTEAEEVDEDTFYKAAILEQHGVEVSGDSLAALEPHVKRELDRPDPVQRSDDDSRAGHAGTV